MQTKNVFITGASSGIGAATATAFAKIGYNIILSARNNEKLRSVEAELKALPNIKVHILVLDIEKIESIENVIKTLPDSFLPIDILVNNAGLALSSDKMQHANLSDWKTMIDTNITGLLGVTHAILPQMVSRNSGHIINLGSIAGHEVYPGGGVYCATKFAVNALTKGLKLDLLGMKIRVTSIDPGIVETNFSNVRFKGDTTKANAVYSKLNPLKPEDIADAIVFAATRPEHVNICEMLIVPTDQADTTHVNYKE